MFQLREPKNRHLVDIRQTESLPANQLIAEVRVLSPEELIAQKVISLTARSNQPKGDTDRRDLKMLLQYPGLKTESGTVTTCLTCAHATQETLAEWAKIVASSIEPQGDDDGF